MDASDIFEFDEDSDCSIDEEKEKEREKKREHQKEIQAQKQEKRKEYYKAVRQRRKRNQKANNVKRDYTWIGVSMEEIKFFSPAIVIDLSFCSIMPGKEVSSVVNQSQHCYGYNRKVRDILEVFSWIQTFVLSL